MKVKSNKTSSKSKVKSLKSESAIPSSTMREKPTFRVESIENGFIVSKSWSDDKGYHETKKYSETNPLEDED